MILCLDPREHGVVRVIFLYVETQDGFLGCAAGSNPMNADSYPVLRSMSLFPSNKELKCKFLGRTPATH